jgi:acyl-CoA synthetase (AMP-forming)/AMP-acid ligase II
VPRLIAILLAAALAGCATTPLPPPPTPAEIVQMAKEGQSADAIIQRIEQSRAVYQMTATQLAQLREQGVPDKVIDYMQQTYIDAARFAEWMRARDAYFFYPYSPFPPYRRYPYWW